MKGGINLLLSTNDGKKSNIHIYSKMNLYQEAHSVSSFGSVIRGMKRSNKVSDNSFFNLVRKIYLFNGFQNRLKNDERDKIVFFMRMYGENSEFIWNYLFSKLQENGYLLIKKGRFERAEYFYKASIRLHQNNPYFPKSIHSIKSYLISKSNLASTILLLFKSAEKHLLWPLYVNPGLSFNL